MKFRRSLSAPDEPIELNLIPLIDVIMFLLIFFISTTSFMDLRGVNVEKPQAGGSAHGENDSIIFAVKGDGDVFYGSQQVGLDGVRPTVIRLCAQKSLSVIIQSDASAQSGLVIRVIDEAKIGGAKDVSLATTRN
jgi:biopolymer transport protein ExbD